MQAPSTKFEEDKLILLLRNEQTREEGFRLLLVQYQERLYSHIRRLVIEHDDTNDVLQNCLLKVYRNIEKFKAQSSLYTWLYRIATNEAMTFLKQRQRRTVNSFYEKNWGVIQEVPADSWVDHDKMQDQLAQALQQLPDRQKQVFVMRYYDELSYQEIADILQISIGGLKASYHHAVKKIERYLINTMI